jgi:hypothetical protein
MVSETDEILLIVEEALEGGIYERRCIDLWEMLLQLSHWRTAQENQILVPWINASGEQIYLSADYSKGSTGPKKITTKCLKAHNAQVDQRQNTVKTGCRNKVTELDL